MKEEARELVAGAAAVLLGLVFFWVSTATLGAVPVTREFKSYVDFTCMTPVCVWDRMGETLRYLSIVGTAFTVAMVAALLVLAKLTRTLKLRF